MNRFGPCLCAAPDCKLCGPALGYPQDEDGMAALEEDGFDLDCDDADDERGVTA